MAADLGAAAGVRRLTDTMIGPVKMLMWTAELLPATTRLGGQVVLPGAPLSASGSPRIGATP